MNKISFNIQSGDFDDATPSPLVSIKGNRLYERLSKLLDFNIAQYFSVHLFDLVNRKSKLKDNLKNNPKNLEARIESDRISCYLREFIRFEYCRRNIDFQAEIDSFKHKYSSAIEIDEYGEIYVMRNAQARQDKYDLLIKWDIPYLQSYDKPVPFRKPYPINFRGDRYIHCCIKVFNKNSPNSNDLIYEWNDSFSSGNKISLNKGNIIELTYSINGKKIISYDGFSSITDLYNKIKDYKGVQDFQSDSFKLFDVKTNNCICTFDSTSYTIQVESHLEDFTTIYENDKNRRHSISIDSILQQDIPTHQINHEYKYYDEFQIILDDNKLKWNQDKWSLIAINLDSNKADIINSIYEIINDTVNKKAYKPKTGHKINYESHIMALIIWDLINVPNCTIRKSPISS